jgi:hypothetical protein
MEYPDGIILNLFLKKIKLLNLHYSKIYGCNLEGCSLDEFQISDNAREGVYATSVCSA